MNLWLFNANDAIQGFVLSYAMGVGFGFVFQSVRFIVLHIVERRD